MPSFSGIFSIILLLFFQINGFGEVSQEKQLIDLVPPCDMNKDGQLTPSENWYARNLSKPKTGRSRLFAQGYVELTGTIE